MVYYFDQAVPLSARSGRGVATHEMPLQLASMQWCADNADRFLAGPDHDLVIAHEFVRDGSRPDVAIARIDMNRFHQMRQAGITPILQRSLLRTFRDCLALRGADITARFLEQHDLMHRHRPNLMRIAKGLEQDIPSERRLSILKARRRMYLSQNTSAELALLCRAGLLQRTRRGIYRVNDAYQGSLSGVWTVEAKMSIRGLHEQMVKHTFSANGGWMIVPIKIAEKLKEQQIEMRASRRERCMAEGREYNPIWDAAGVLSYDDGQITELLAPLDVTYSTPLDRLLWEQAFYSRYLEENHTHTDKRA